MRYRREPWGTCRDSRNYELNLTWNKQQTLHLSTSFIQVCPLLAINFESTTRVPSAWSSKVGLFWIRELVDVFFSFGWFLMFATHRARCVVSILQRRDILRGYVKCSAGYATLPRVVTYWFCRWTKRSWSFNKSLPSVDLANCLFCGCNFLLKSL